MKVVQAPVKKTRVKRVTSSAILAALLFLNPSCATLPGLDSVGLRAPETFPVEAELVSAELAKKDLAPALRTALLYRKANGHLARGETAQACGDFSEALLVGSQLPDPAFRLVQLRKLQACSDGDIDVNAFPKWLEEEIARARLSIGNRTRNTSLTGEALYALSFFERSEAARLARLQEAMRSIEKSENKTPSIQQNIQNRIYAVAPRFIPEPQVGDWVAVANDLKNAREFVRARQYFNEVANSKSHNVTEKLKALDGIRQTYKLQLKTEEHIAASHKWAGFAQQEFMKLRKRKRKDPALTRAFFEAQVQLARAVWTDHRRDEARMILLKTEALVGREISTHESKLIRARMAEETGQLEDMENVLDSIEINALPDRSTKAKILWFKGWNQRRLKRFEPAIANLEQAIGFEDSGSARARNQYWIGRIQQESANSNAAVQTFEALAVDNQFGIYGMLAQRELRRPFAPLKANSTSTARPSKLSDLTVAVAWFSALDEIDAGRRLLNSVSTLRLWNPRADLEERETALELFSKLGLHAQVTAKLEEMEPALRNQLLNQNPSLMFPKPFADIVDREAQKQGINGALTYSIMRQESQFNPFARSAADAFGLMQLIPEMAAKAGARAGVHIQQPEDLFVPATNIALGSAFLAQLSQRYSSRFILYVAAYNANDRAIQGWLKTRLRSDPVEFIEEIPYDETRLYIKLVMRNYIGYSRLNSLTPFVFPEELLRL